MAPPLCSRSIAAQISTVLLSGDPTVPDMAMWQVMPCAWAGRRIAGTIRTAATPADRCNMRQRLIPAACRSF